MMDKPRASNIELLRIISMLMIVVYHIINHGIVPRSGYYNMPVMLSVFENLVVFGVNLFVLISGYFLIKLTWKSFFNLMWMIAFYKLFHLSADTFILGVSHPWYEWVLKPLSGPMSGGGWFVDVYVLLMLISPMVNKLLQTISRKEYVFSLLILLVLDVGYGFLLNKHFDSYGYSLMHFIVMYFIGYGIGRYLHIPSGKIVFFLLGSLALTCMVSLLPVSVLYKLEGYNNPLVMFSSCCIFLLFANMKLAYNKMINFVAASMLPVYLIHEGGNVGATLYKMIGEWWISFSTPTFFMHILLFVIVLFSFAILIDQPRKWLAKYIVIPLARGGRNITTQFRERKRSI